MSSSCVIPINIQVLSVDFIVNSNPNLLTRFFSIFDIAGCFLNNKYYDSNGNVTNTTQDNGCDCNNFQFILNLMYYLDQYNQCVFGEGDVNTSTFSSSIQTVDIYIYTSGNLSNVTIQNQQNESTNLKMIDLRNANTQAVLQDQYTQLCENLIAAFSAAGNSQYSYINLSTTDIQSSINESFQYSMNTMMNSQQNFVIYISESTWKSLPITSKQQSLQKLFMNQFTNNMSKQIYNSVVRNKFPKSCSTTTTFSSFRTTQKDFIFIILLTIVVIYILVVIFERDE